MLPGKVVIGVKYGECIHNPGVECYRYPTYTPECDNMQCGWNPPVMESRIAEIRRRMEWRARHTRKPTKTDTASGRDET